MMDVVLAKLDRISGDAVKLAVWIAEFGASIETQLDGSVLVSFNATAELVSACSKILSLPPAVVRKCLAELVNHGALTKSGRSRYWSNLSSMSYPHRSFARSPEAERSEAEGPCEDEVEHPPWEAACEAGRKGPRSGTIGGEQTEPGSERGVGGRDLKWGAMSEARTRAASTLLETPPSKLSVCSFCGELEHTQALEQGCMEAGRVSPHQFVIDAVVKMYADCYAGQKLRVDGRVGKIVKILLRTHTAAEIVRRARFMFYEPRRWPPPPYHFGSLSVHFDSFIPMKKSAGGMADRDVKKTGATYYGEVDDV
jgi:hypothetical protein